MRTVGKQAFASGLNDILVIAAGVAFVGALSAAVTIRPKDFVRSDAPEGGDAAAGSRAHEGGHAPAGGLAAEGAPAGG